MMLLRALKCDPFGAENGLVAVQAFEPAATSVDALKALLKSKHKSAGAGQPDTQGSEYALVLMDGNMRQLLPHKQRVAGTQPASHRDCAGCSGCIDPRD